MINISINTAQNIAVHAQSLDKDSPDTSLHNVLEHLVCVQIDAIQAVRRSHEMVLLSRGVKKEIVDNLHTAENKIFETWGHAHSIFPQSAWPLLKWRRDLIRQNGLSGPPLDRNIAHKVLAHIELNGPCTVGDISSSTGKGWDRGAPEKTACEWLASIGELVVVSRDNRWRRIYQTPDQANMDTSEPLSTQESLWQSVIASQQALGIATKEDIIDYLRLPSKTPVRDILLSSGYEEARIEGIKNTYYVHPKTLNEISEINEIITPVSPLDSIVWTRKRQAEIFKKNYLFEAYKPTNKREFGYFSMPIFRNSRIIGRVAARKNPKGIAIENIEIDESSEYSLSYIQSKVKEILQSWI